MRFLPSRLNRKRPADMARVKRHALRLGVIPEDVQGFLCRFNDFCRYDTAK